MLIAPEKSSVLGTQTHGPELLAPAGDRTCLVAAIENGADAVYFGLQGHNARARAVNFSVDELPEIMALLHGRGVRGYVAVNTLIFPAELPGAEKLIRKIARAGVDAVIVQDLGLVRLIRDLAPDLEIHASTQMSVTSVEGVRLAKDLGCSRVILARELSIEEIAQIRREAELPVEVFVHGALCVAYSGQCLTSEALGGRSANRGECAQACRMPYEIVCDGKLVDLDNIQYLLSPQDLAAFDLIPKLVEIGVASLKIEGRLKTPEYVASITRSYRRAIDETMASGRVEFSTNDVHDMEMTFSRGFCHGFLDGNNHKILVRGDHAKKRGVHLGLITGFSQQAVRIQLASSIKPGDGVVFDGDDVAGVPEQGGRVYEVRPIGQPAAGIVELGFGHRDLDVAKLRVGQSAWKTDDPELNKRIRTTFEGHPHRLVDLFLQVRAVSGEKLFLTGRTATGFVAEVSSVEPLPPAQRHPASVDTLREAVDRFGGTIYRLESLEAWIDGEPMVPKSLLNGLRRDLVAKLDEQTGGVSGRIVADESILPGLRARMTSERSADSGLVELSALCRSIEQAEAAIDSGVKQVYLEFSDIQGYATAVPRLRALSPQTSLFLVTPRIQKPGEGQIFRYLDRRGADGILVRNAGGLEYCVRHNVPFVADFSLNASNELTVDWLQTQGAQRVTASYDLSFDQLDDLIAAVPPGWLEVVVHQHMPMFHMEHCVFCAFLSPGTDKTNCGRPCDHHDVKLKDRVGMEHPLTADVGCRNTLYNAVAQTAAEYLPRLMARGVRHFRVEFLEEDANAVRTTLRLYREVLENRRDPRSLWKDLKATNRYGVTRGQLAVLQIDEHEKTPG